MNHVNECMLSSIPVMRWNEVKLHRVATVVSQQFHWLA